MVYESIHPAVYDEINAQIEHIGSDRLLAEATNFVAREAARRLLDRSVVDRLETLMQDADKGPKKRLRALKRQALGVKSVLEQANERLFATFRNKLKREDYTTAELIELFRGYIEPSSSEEWSDPPRYDYLDTFIDGVLQISVTPRQQRQPEPEMVYYQPTPARIVLDMVARLRLTQDDVFYDLGSGLGRVPILVALVSDARAKGVEFEPAYHDYAQRRVRDLRIPRVTCINADVRDVNYADGTVFFLYTPFRGKILQRVFDLLRYESRKRNISICTYGPGTLDAARQSWLGSIDDQEPDIHHVTIFHRRED